MVLPNRILAYVLIVLSLLFAAGVVKQWYFPNADDAPQVLTIRPRQRTVLTPSKEVRSAPKQVETVKVLTPRLSAKDQRAVEKRFSLDLNHDKLLTTAVVPQSPGGGEVAVTLSPDGNVETSFTPSRPPFFALGGPLEVGGGALLSSDGQGFRLFASKELLRVAFLRLRVEGDLDVANGQNRGSVALLVVYRR